MNRQKRKALQALNTRQGLTSKLLEAQQHAESLKKDLIRSHNQFEVLKQRLDEQISLNQRLAAYRLQIERLQPQRQIAVRLVIDEYRLFHPSFIDMRESLAEELVSRLKYEYMKGQDGFQMRDR